MVEHPNQLQEQFFQLTGKLVEVKILGIDTCIFVLADEKKFNYSNHTAQFLRPGTYKGLVNYEIEVYQRYYSKTYHRGHWPTISKCLMELLADPYVKTVYYLPDHVDLDMEKVTPFTQEDLFRLTAFYIQDTKFSEPY